LREAKYTDASESLKEFTINASFLVASVKIYRLQIDSLNWCKTAVFDANCTLWVLAVLLCSSANKCLMKVAQFSAQRELFEKAAEIYEEVNFSIVISVIFTRECVWVYVCEVCMHMELT